MLDERNPEQAPTLFALPKQVWYPRVKQHLHGPLERSAHSSYVFPRNAHRFCTTQSEKDKLTQISKIQNYMVTCTCRQRGRAPFSLNFLSTDQTHASGRAAAVFSIAGAHPALHFFLCHIQLSRRPGNLFYLFAPLKTSQKSPRDVRTMAFKHACSMCSLACLASLACSTRQPASPACTVDLRRTLGW